jgi:peptidoglycan/LPS O-acetylase OafA/YrhL
MLSSSEVSQVAVAEQRDRYRGYVPELDGLRALAILAVVLFHLHAPGFSIGWAGVTLFFVISGFLITRILLTTSGRPHYFRNFYARRSLRIFPIYYLTVGLYFLALAVAPHHSGVYKWLAGTAAHPFAQLPYYLTYLQTIPQLRSSYADLPSLTVTWTLAIEEQFYWLWPFVVAAVPRRALLPTLATLFVIGLLTRAILFASGANPYYLVGMLPDQLDALAIGAAIALLVVWNLERDRLNRLGLTCLLVGAAVTVLLFIRTGYSAFWEPLKWASQRHNVLLFTGMALLFGGLVLLSVTESRLVRWLRNPILVHVGKISYGIYLYHGFVIYVVMSAAFKAKIGAEFGSPLIVRIGLALLCLAGSYVAALASWRLFETPILSLKSRFTKTE